VGESVKTGSTISVTATASNPVQGLGDGDTATSATARSDGDGTIAGAPVESPTTAIARDLQDLTMQCDGPGSTVLSRSSPPPVHQPRLTSDSELECDSSNGEGYTNGDSSAGDLSSMSNGSIVPVSPRANHTTQNDGADVLLSRATVAPPASAVAVADDLADSLDHLAISVPSPIPDRRMAKKTPAKRIILSSDEDEDDIDADNSVDGPGAEQVSSMISPRQRLSFGVSPPDSTSPIAIPSSTTRRRKLIREKSPSTTDGSGSDSDDSPRQEEARPVRHRRHQTSELEPDEIVVISSDDSLEECPSSWTVEGEEDGDDSFIV
jgi:hypothetical protein